MKDRFICDAKFSGGLTIVAPKLPQTITYPPCAAQDRSFSTHTKLIYADETCRHVRVTHFVSLHESTSKMESVGIIGVGSIGLCAIRCKCCAKDWRVLLFLELI